MTPKTVSGKWKRNKSDLMIKQTGQIYCTHGAHYAEFENSHRIVTKDRTRWIYGRCYDKRLEHLQIGMK